MSPVDPTGSLEDAIRRFEHQRTVARQLAEAWRVTTVVVLMVPLALWWGAPDSLFTMRGAVGLGGLLGGIFLAHRAVRHARDEVLGQQHDRLTLEARTIERAMRRLPSASETGE